MTHGTDFSPKPSMLFVDDRTVRIHYAMQRLSREFDVVIATNVPEALRLLSNYEFDYISLDHDLNGHDFQSINEDGTGAEIVLWMVETWPHEKKPGIIIHTSNMFAAKHMRRILECGEDQFSVVMQPISKTQGYLDFKEAFKWTV